MTKIDWSESLHVGHAVIDADHAEAVELLNRIHDVVDDGDPALEGLVDRFITHCREHFAREEELMRRHGFFAYPMHAGEHQRVLAEMDHYRARLAENGVDGVRDYFRDGLINWFLAHRASMDTITAGFIRQVTGG